MPKPRIESLHPESLAISVQPAESDLRRQNIYRSRHPEGEGIRFGPVGLGETGKYDEK